MALGADLEWNQLGFQGRPYSPRPLAGDEESRKLLVGRDGQLAEIRSHLHASSQHLTIDGPNGSGKTSLVRCVLGEIAAQAQEYSHGELLIPLDEPVNLNVGESPEAFEQKMLAILASLLADNKKLIRRAGHSSGERLDDLARLTDSPFFKGGSLGGGFTGIGVSGSRSTAANPEYRKLGLRRALLQELKAAFPADEAGALIVCIDNAEALKSRKKLRAFMDAIRDPLLGLPGVRWIFLGANGILEGLGNYERLSGVIAPALRLHDLSPNEAAEAVERRIEHFGYGDVTVPVGGVAFQHVYESCGRHLRTALGICEQFSLQASLRGFLTDSHLVETVRETDGERWRRYELPASFVATFVEEESAKRWDEVGELGGAARALLRELEGPKALEMADLDLDDEQRKKALNLLRREAFVIGVQSKRDGRRVALKLTASGTLAATGGRLVA